ncbi:MAG: hypothetical protein LDL31_06480 [Prosthecobacter sp.]|jgi:type II secretion system protein D|nr:hypothetical protein [Prosthecobacter sp.]
MSHLHRLFFLGFILVGSALAQIPQQPVRPPTNPNAIPPAGAPRPFTRPAAPPQPALPSAAGAPDGTEKPAKKPEEAITPDGMVQLQYPNTQLGEILLLYEELTGLKIIRDANAEQATVSIETTGELSKEKAIMYIEKSLLLNGYAFTPAGEGMVKLLAFDAKKPSMEGAPLIESASDLPVTDQVVSFVTQLRYLGTEDAIKAIDQVIPRHSYGVITPVPNARALVITENSNTIRSILALMERLDNKPAETIQKTLQLSRSSAEDVKKALDEILGTEEKNNGSGKTPAIPQNTPGTVPGQPATPTMPTAAYDGAGGSAEAAPPKIIPIARRNCLLVIGAQEQVDYISRLVEELDAASDLRTFASRPLKYLAVDAAMQIISDAITRTEGDDSGGSSTSTGTGGQNNNAQNRNNNNVGGNSSSLFGNNSNSLNNGLNGGFGSGLGGGLGGSSSFGTGGGNLTPLRQNNGPSSVLVGKTLLISDPVSNSIFASGPPEHLRILNEIMDELDRRPQQILISAVIGDYQIGDSVGFGIETLIRGRENGTATGADRGLAGQLGAFTGTPLDPRTRITPANLAAAGNGLTFFGGVRDGLDVLVQALDSKTDFKVISRPSVFTMNNMQATISSGQSFPIATSTQGLVGGGANSGLLSNVQYQDVVLSLNIVPLINSSDELTLQISQQNSEQAGTTTIADNPYPILTKQELNTTVVCRNNGTVLLGGLIREDNNIRKTNVPILSSIPVLKYLTGSRSRSNNRRELIIMIQPSIVEGLNDLPPSAAHSSGSSLFAEETQAVFNQEKTRAASAMLPPAPKPKFSERLKGMFKKMLQ